MTRPISPDVCTTQAPIATGTAFKNWTRQRMPRFRPRTRTLRGGAEIATSWRADRSPATGRVHSHRCVLEPVFALQCEKRAGLVSIPQRFFGSSGSRAPRTIHRGPPTRESAVSTRGVLTSLAFSTQSVIDPATADKSSQGGRQIFVHAVHRCLTRMRASDEPYFSTPWHSA